MTPRLQIATLLVALALGTGFTARAADDPMDGTWKLNLAKSKIDPGPGPKSLVNKYQSDSKGNVKVTTDNVSATGESTHREYTERYDGKEYDANSRGGDTVTLKRIDSHTIEGFYKRNGKVRATFRRTVSKDGKTMTTESQGESPNVKGQPYHDVRVFDKQ